MSEPIFIPGHFPDLPPDPSKDLSPEEANHLALIEAEHGIELVNKLLSTEEFQWVFAQLRNEETRVIQDLVEGKIPYDGVVEKLKLFHEARRVRLFPLVLQARYRKTIEDLGPASKSLKNNPQIN